MKDNFFLKRSLSIISVMAIIVIMSFSLFSCDDEYFMKHHNSNIGGTGNDDNNNDDDNNDDDNGNGGDTPIDTLIDLEDSTKHVYRYLEKDELSAIDSSLTDFNIKVYAPKGRSKTKTVPVVIFTKDLFNEANANNEVDTWIENNVINNTNINTLNGVLIVTNYSMPNNVYQYKNSDTDTAWTDTTINNYESLANLSKTAIQNIRYKNIGKNELQSTIDDFDNIINKLIIQNAEKWHMNSNRVSIVSLGYYTTSAVIHAVGKAAYKAKVEKINGLTPIIAFSEGTKEKPSAGIIPKPNIDYNETPAEEDPDSLALIKAFSNLRLSKHFFSSYISNTDTDILSKYNLVDLFALKKIAQKCFFITSDEDSGMSPSGITGRPILLRDNVSHSKYGMKSIIQADSLLDYKYLNFGNQGGSYYNWPSNTTKLNELLKELVLKHAINKLP